MPGIKSTTIIVEKWKREFTDDKPSESLLTLEGLDKASGLKIGFIFRDIAQVIKAQNTLKQLPRSVTVVTEGLPPLRMNSRVPYYEGINIA